MTAKRKTKASAGRQPTIRQRRAAKLLVGKGSKSVASVMREVGYSKETAKVPGKLTKSKSWAILMDEYLPQDKVAKVHAELLEAEETVFIPRGKEILERKRPDFRARKAGVDMANKLRGNYAAEKIELSRRKFQDMPDAELAAAIREAKQALKKK